MPRILICDKLEADGLAVLEKAGLQVDNRPGLTGKELQAALQAADGAIIRLATRITADLLENPGKLRIIVRAGAGVDNIDVVAATRKGVIVMNTPSSNTFSACEHTWGLILALARQIPTADAVIHQGGWDRQKFLGMQLAGKTLGIIGVGRIGREVGKRGLAMGMKIIGYDPILTADRMTSLGVAAAHDVNAVLQQADIVTLHIPLNAETKDLIGKTQLAQMKKGSFLINCARGGIVDENALVEALQSGHLGGAALDVFAQEPPAADHPLRALPNVILTPHIGAATLEAQRSIALEAAQVMVDFFTRSQMQATFNVASFDENEFANLKPYLVAARRLGLLLSQIQEGPVTRVKLTFSGQLPECGMSWLSSSLAVGLLENRLSERLTPANAIILAKERGINIVQEHDPMSGDYRSLLTMEIASGQVTHKVSSSLFSNQSLRIVQFDDFNLEANLDGQLLVIVCQDFSRLLGSLGAFFDRHGANITKMALDRSCQNGQYMTIINLDKPQRNLALDEIRSHKQINSAYLISLPEADELPVWLH